MDQEDTMDFKALRAKFQEEELLLRQPKMKPALPEKPKVVPPPKSPPHYLPAGARPSLLTSINQSLGGKFAPRVVFKDEKKESKKPLIPNNTKGKDKNEGKVKGGKDTATKGSKEKPEDGSEDQKQKKESSKDKKTPLVVPVAPKENSTELVTAPAPPKATKKKGFLGFRKSSKKYTVTDPADPILDMPTLGDPGPVLLLPVPAEFVDSEPEPEAEVSAPEALLPNIPTLPDATAESEAAAPSIIPASDDSTPPPVLIPDTPAPEVPTPESETPTEVETPALPVSRPPSQNESIANPPSAVPTPSSSPAPLASPSPPPVASTSPPSTPKSEITAVASEEAVDTTAVEEPPPQVEEPFPQVEEPSPEVEEPPSQVEDTPSIPPSPKDERPISALSVLERAEDMSPGKRSLPCDQRVLSALEKARNKTTRPNLSTSNPTTPPPEELSPTHSPTVSLPELPPIDYEAGSSLPPKPEQVNGIDPGVSADVLSTDFTALEPSNSRCWNIDVDDGVKRAEVSFGYGQASPVLEGTNGEGSEDIPALLVVPPPTPRKSLCVAPETPPKPASVTLNDCSPPCLQEQEIHVPNEVSETNINDVPEVEDLASDAQSAELPVSQPGNGECTEPDGADKQNLPECYSNGITAPEVDAQGVPVSGDEYQDNPQSNLYDTSLPIAQEAQTTAGPQAEEGNGIYESAENVYEDITTSATKKKGKNDKKRKGPPKNPYAESPQEPNEGKIKIGRFGRNDKKSTSEGPDEKELKKKEKQRLEKEKKELKEKQEREKKEQKEREKKENEMKKKFKIAGNEDAMYEAKVTVTTKGRKNDLPVKSGDIISIIRTTNCPKGKWLARDSSNNYGYIAVDHVELDIKEMLELGKKAAITRRHSSNILEAEVPRSESRASNHYPISAESFEEDSDEEWNCDDDELLPPTSETDAPPASTGHTRTTSMPDMGNKDLSINHQHSHSDLCPDGSHVEGRHEALQKLATFFHSPKPEEPTASSTEPETNLVLVEEEAVHLPEASPIQEDMDFEHPELLILPPPDVYADLVVE